MAFLLPALVVYHLKTAEKKHVELQKFDQAMQLQCSKSYGDRLVTETCIAFETETRPETFETETHKNGSRDSITAYSTNGLLKLRLIKNLLG